MVLGEPCDGVVQLRLNHCSKLICYLRDRGYFVSQFQYYCCFRLLFVVVVVLVLGFFVCFAIKRHWLRYLLG